MYEIIKKIKIDTKIIAIKTNICLIQQNHNLLIRIGRLRKVERIALVRGQRDAGNVRSKVQQERVQSGAQAHRRDDAQADPVQHEADIAAERLHQWRVHTLDGVQRGQAGGERDQRQDPVLVFVKSVRTETMD